MYVVKHRASGQLASYGEPMPVAAMIPATQDGVGAGQAVGLVLAFFSTLMFMTSMMLQGSSR